MLKVKTKSNRRSGVFIVNFEYTWHGSGGVFFAEFEHVHAGWNTSMPYSKLIYTFQSRIQEPCHI